MNAIETLISVLCDPEGKCCISGSDDDRRLIDSALAEIAQAAQPAPAQADSVLEDAARYRALRDEANQLHEDDISVSDSSFTTYFGSDLDEAVDALVKRAARKQGANHDR